MEKVRQFLPLLLLISLALIVSAFGPQAQWRDLACLLRWHSRRRAVATAGPVGCRQERPR